MADGKLPRPKADTPQHQILDSLEDLRERLNRHDQGVPNSDLLRKYDYFCRHSDMHRGCQYSLKCKSLFFLTDFQEIRELIQRVEALIEEFEQNGYE